MEQFPDLTLTLRDHGFISVLNGRAAVVPRSVPNGTHHPNGILVASGPGIKAGQSVESCNLLDIAPLLTHSLGMEIPADYEGHVPTDLYEADYLASDPPRVAAAAEGAAPVESEAVPAAADDGGDLDEEDEAIILARLKSLGYIE